MKQVILILSAFYLMSANSVEVEIAVASMMHNLENESSIVFGDHVRKGIYLSLNHNSEKLVKKGIEVKLTEYSYTSETRSILSIAKKIENSAAIAVHGYDYSSHALLSQHIHKNKGLSVVLPTATSDKIVAGVDNYFQIAGNNYSQAKAMVRYLSSNNARTATVIKRPSCAYCVDLAKSLVDVAKNENINLNVIDADSPVNIKKVSTNYVLLPMYETEAIQFIKKLSHTDKSKIYIGGDAWTSKGERYFKLLGNLEFKAVCLGHWNINKIDAASNKFSSDFKKFFGSNASDVSALSYDAMNFIIEGLTSVKNISRNEVKKYLASKSKMTGITGSHEKGSHLKSGFVLLSWDKKKFRMINEI
jgi:ABC-type branched-subunit amino acid transport system substrate-binding protein